MYLLLEAQVQLLFEEEVQLLASRGYAVLEVKAFYGWEKYQSIAVPNDDLRYIAGGYAELKPEPFQSLMGTSVFDYHGEGDGRACTTLSSVSPWQSPREAKVVVVQRWVAEMLSEEICLDMLVVTKKDAVEMGFTVGEPEPAQSAASRRPPAAHGLLSRR